jgi:L-asparagine oxygenase
MDRAGASATMTHARPRTVRAGDSAESHAAPATDEAGVESEAFIAVATEHGRGLPDAIRSAIETFKAHSDPSGAVLLRGLPIGHIPATPSTPTTPTTKDRTSELTLLGVASLLGEPVGYLPELGGRIVQNLLPVKSNATRQTSTSSDVTLMWHTETAFHPFKPRYLLLLCLKGDPAAHTLLCSINAILDGLRNETIATLREPRFRISPDESFLDEGSVGELSDPMPVLRGHGDDLEFTFDAELMVGTDDEASAALRELSALIDRANIGVVLQAGDLLVVDNHRAVHGRSSFTARFDGTDRWLQRTFVIADLQPSAASRTGRIVTTLF